MSNIKCSNRTNRSFGEDPRSEQEKRRFKPRNHPRLVSKREDKAMKRNTQRAGGGRWPNKTNATEEASDKRDPRLDLLISRTLV